ncbi:tyrosine-type recombinase/integrase [Lentimicrobium sp. L6]|uniref:tyrosine-type recombinase/integrase n=1 Tax=Lentimicrobium sp. L6 TaxID=2735916 RepID=UPI0015557351|nr:tyrosine-type recombinase/integrase [Lentimicrobium sp. L6]NPD85349.1 tyrosine-type recombinase/integrase [Lentimicrobium sp. L6]
MRATASIFYDKRRKTKDGYPFKLRITNLRQTSFISLKLYMSLKEYKDYTSLKRLPKNITSIKKKLIQYEAKANLILDEMKDFDFELFKENFSGTKPKAVQKVFINDLFQERADEFKSKEKYNTAITYVNTQKALLRFRKGIRIAQVNSKLLEDFHSFLISESKSISTVSIYMRAFKAVVNANKELFKVYPFDKYKVPQANNNKRALTEKRLKKVLSYKFKIDAFNFYMDLYRFSYFSGGVNIKDIVLLKKKNLQGEYLVYHRAKTNKPIKIYLLPEAKEIIEKYTSANDFIFPVLENEEAEHVYKKVNSLTIKINYTLKQACEELQIPKITTYSARHSFATILMNKGASIVFISQSLGHQNIATTQNYLGSFTDQQMKDSMMKLV